MQALQKLLPADVLPLVKEVLESENPMTAMKAGAGKSPAAFFEASKARAIANADHVNTEWEMREGDVLVASYPKTGTNWTLEVVNRMLFQEESELQKWKSLPLPLTMIEMGIPKKFKIIDAIPIKRRVLGSHFPGGIMDINRIVAKKVKIVYVVRNPKDTLVSMFNFLKKLPPFQQEPMKAMVSNGFAHFYQHYMKGDFPMASYEEKTQNYLEHIQTWLKVKEQADVYFLYYENMKKDFKGEVTKLAAFLDVKLSAEKLEEITAKCTIDAMKQSYASRPGFQAQHAGAFINKGGVGGWKDYFTVAQSEEWDREVAEKLAGTEVKFQYTI